MQIRARMSMSVDGYVTTPDGWPALTADPAFGSGQSHGIREFLADCEAALMGRTTFEPALTNARWPWPNLDVFVLASHRPEGTPDHVVTETDPARLLERIKAANSGGDVHLVGGPRTIETFRALGALDSLELVVLPLLFGGGMQLTPSLSPEESVAIHWPVIASASAVAAAVAAPSTKRRTVAPASAVPLTVGFGLLLSAASVAMLGAAGAAVSIFTVSIVEGGLVLPAASVAVAVKLWMPSASGAAGLRLQPPDELAVTLPSRLPPS